MTVPLKFTSIPSVSSLATSSRYVQSTFLQNEASNFTWRSPESFGNIDFSGSDVVVINPGSRFLKIGLAKDAFPQVVPHVIAEKSRCECFYEDESSLDCEHLQEYLNNRHKQSRKKPPPNIYQSISSFNKGVSSQEISAHNDAFSFEWTDVRDRSACLVGVDALRINPSEGYQLRWPFCRGSFSRRYRSFRQVVGDLVRIWRGVLKDLKLSKYSLILVVPDHLERFEIKALTEAAFMCRFRAVAFIQEAVAATFGAGVSAACVVNVGAQHTSVCCVEDGLLLGDLRIKLGYGGDDLTGLFAQILRLHSFPYAFDLKRPLDFELVNDLKEKLCTLDEDDVSSMVHEFYVRTPGRTTLLYSFKVFEERIIVPLAMLEPGAPWLKSSRQSGDFYAGSFETEDTAMAAEEKEDSIAAFESALFDNSQIQTKSRFAARFDGQTRIFQTLEEALSSCRDYCKGPCRWEGCSAEPMDEISWNCHLVNHLTSANSDSSAQEQEQTQEIDSNSQLSIDQAIIKCINPLAASNPEKCRRMLSSVLLIGGSVQFPHFSNALSSRLEQYKPEFIANARDLDPRFVAWKGGAVLAKLESVQEAWITAKEWENVGQRIFKERLIFNW